jgi:hypothetical protein
LKFKERLRQPWAAVSISLGALGGVTAFISLILGLGWLLASTISLGIVCAILLLVIWGRGGTPSDATAPQSNVQLEVEELEDKIDGLRARLSEYMWALREVDRRHEIPFSEHLRVTFFVGATREADRVDRYQQTQAREGHSLLYRNFVAEADGDNQRYASFEDIKVRASSDQRSLTFLPIGESVGGLEGMVVFQPPIDSKPVDWFLTYTWPGMFDILRGKRKDVVTFRGSRGIDVLEIHLVVDSRLAKPRWTGTPLEGNAGDTRRTEKGDWLLTWRLDAPSEKKYEFGIALG